MSDHEDRKAIAAAVNNVDGLDCSANFRQTTRPGSGAVQWAGLDRAGNGFGYMNRWNVLVILPQDVAAAETWLEAHLDELLDNVARELVIQTANPEQIITDSGTLLAVVIEGVRARE